MNLNLRIRAKDADNRLVKAPILHTSTRTYGTYSSIFDLSTSYFNFIFNFISSQILRSNYSYRNSYSSIRPPLEFRQNFSSFFTTRTAASIAAMFGGM